jgi:hypothetical protein
VEPNRPSEDDRGVDVGQIRRQLRMPIPDRVREMVHAANELIAVRDYSRGTPLSDG